MSPASTATLEGRLHGFLVRDGAFETIDYPSSVNTGTLVMNNQGLIVGGFIDANGREPGFMARDPRGFQRRIIGATALRLLVILSVAGCDKPISALSDTAATEPERV
jgi:hypothetical protein